MPRSLQFILQNEAKLSFEPRNKFKNRYQYKFHWVRCTVLKEGDEERRINQEGKRYLSQREV